jgi:hypothetical protein
LADLARHLQDRNWTDLHLRFCFFADHLRAEH